MPEILEKLIGELSDFSINWYDQYNCVLLTVLSDTNSIQLRLFVLHLNKGKIRYWIKSPTKRIPLICTTKYNYVWISIELDFPNGSPPKRRHLWGLSLPVIVNCIYEAFEGTPEESPENSGYAYLCRLWRAFSLFQDFCVKIWKHRSSLISSCYWANKALLAKTFSNLS